MNFFESMKNIQSVSINSPIRIESGGRHGKKANYWPRKGIQSALTLPKEESDTQ